MTFIPDIRYNEKPDSIEKKSVGCTPIPLNEKGLTGFEKYPFFGKKKENDIPSSWEKDFFVKKRKIIKKSRMVLEIVFIYFITFDILLDDNKV
jgi:hypothetical protein